MFRIFKLKKLLKEQKTLLEDATKTIKEKQANIDNRDKLIKDLMHKNAKQTDFINEITKIATRNTYNNKVNTLSKIRELVRAFNEN